MRHDVYEAENGQGVIVTAYCQVGGCTVESITEKSYETARIKAKELEEGGQRPKSIGICNDCLTQNKGKNTCPRCEDRLLSTYDYKPDYAKFCMTCGYSC